jgi:phage-related protein
MSVLTLLSIRESDRPLVWLRERVQSPPFSALARHTAGHLLRRVQNGEQLAMPHSRPMPVIGRRCHELRVRDGDLTWRIFYRVDADAVVVIDILAKKTEQTPSGTIQVCRARLAEYDRATLEE